MRRIKLRTFRTPRDFCPHCGHRMDAASSFHHDGEVAVAPKPGDVSVCIGCTAFLRWSADAPGTGIVLVPLPSFDGLTAVAVNRLLELRAAVRMAKACGPVSRPLKKEVTH